MADEFLQDARALLKDQETEIEETRKNLTTKLGETETKEKFLEEKARQVRMRRPVSAFPLDPPPREDCTKVHPAVTTGIQEHKTHPSFWHPKLGNILVENLLYVTLI